MKRAGDTDVGIMTQVLVTNTMYKALKSTSTLINLLLKVKAEIDLKINNTTFR